MHVGADVLGLFLTQLGRTSHPLLVALQARPDSLDLLDFMDLLEFAICAACRRVSSVLHRHQVRGRVCFSQSFKFRALLTPQVPIRAEMLVPLVLGAFIQKLQAALLGQLLPLEAFPVLPVLALLKLLIRCFFSREVGLEFFIVFLQIVLLDFSLLLVLCLHLFLPFELLRQQLFHVTLLLIRVLMLAIKDHLPVPLRPFCEVRVAEELWRELPSGLGPTKFIILVRIGCLRKSGAFGRSLMRTTVRQTALRDMLTVGFHGTLEHAFVMGHRQTSEVPKSN